VITGVSEIPEVGSIVSPLVDILWPSGTNVWQAIKARVEALIEQAFDDYEWNRVSDELTGLKNVTNDYLHSLVLQDNDNIRQKYNVAQELYRDRLPQFQMKGYELLLLPLFAQFSNLHLMLLRDGATKGSAWGWSSQIVDDIRNTLAETITSYVAYTEDIYQNGLADAQERGDHNRKHKKNHDDHHYTLYPFWTVNSYVREMTLTVLDYKELWPYLDVNKYPNGKDDVYLGREIYSDPEGTADDAHSRRVPWPGEKGAPSVPTDPITNVEVWSGGLIEACQVTYPETGGPGGTKTTGKMGYPTVSKETVLRTFDLGQTGPIVSVTVTAGDALRSWVFEFKNKSTSDHMGGSNQHEHVHVLSYDGHIVSSMFVPGYSGYYLSADSVVFGFKFEKK
jgi:hypothetical protein